MMIRNCTLRVLILLFSVGLCALAQGGTEQRVKFPPGRTTAVLKGTLRGITDARYVLRAQRGQTLTAHLSVGRNEYASLQIIGPDGNSLTAADGSDVGDDFSVTLPRMGDYHFVVFPPDTSGRRDLAHYTLEITIR